MNHKGKFLDPEYRDVWWTQYKHGLTRFNKAFAKKLAYQAADTLTNRAPACGSDSEECMCIWWRMDKDPAQCLGCGLNKFMKGDDA